MNGIDFDRKGVEMNSKKQNKKAFTLVELLVVILIISLIATVLVPRVFKGLGSAKKDIAKAKITNIEGALGQFNLKCGHILMIQKVLKH